MSTWYELRPESRPAGEGERYGAQDEAEQAATAMLIRQPELLSSRSPGVARGRPATVVGRISPSQPPAPSEAAIDDLHKLPRGAPEQ